MSQQINGYAFSSRRSSVGSISQFTGNNFVILGAYIRWGFVVGCFSRNIKFIYNIYLTES